MKLHQLRILWMMLLVGFPLFYIPTNTVAQARAGRPLPNLTPGEWQIFNTGKEDFMEVGSVSGGEPGAEGVGLGPRFNSNSCLSCHAQPAVGGSSPKVNLQIESAKRFGAKNVIPSFIQPNGPSRIARFKYKIKNNLLTNELDGGIYNLFVITGRADARGCNIKQPDFEREVKRNNVALRIATPLFGLGLVEMIPDKTIVSNQLRDVDLKSQLGIAGHVNRVSSSQGHAIRSGNDGTITRFGWKAQNKSLAIFAGEAYNVEQGVTNDLFPNEREEEESCLFNGTPEDHPSFDGEVSLGDVTTFTQFMRFLAPPTPAPSTSSSKRGADLFSKVGCSMCHTPTMRTGNSTSAALAYQPVNLYSDLLVHAMGVGLADYIIQGDAGPDGFRTAPLWGVGERLFYLHDGRTTDLKQAILAHASVNSKCKSNEVVDKDGVACKSEANKVIENFNKLAAGDQNSIVDFLKTL